MSNTISRPIRIFLGAILAVNALICFAVGIIVIPRQAAIIEKIDAIDQRIERNEQRIKINRQAVEKLDPKESP